MGKKAKSKKKDKGGGQPQGIQVRAGSFRLDMPMPRLPKWIGTPNLRAGQAIYPRVNLDVNISPQAAVITAGGVAAVLNIDTTLIPNWGSRFASLFKEFAIVGARFEIRSTTTSAGQGLALAYIDEQSNAAPTASALDYAHAEIPIVPQTIDSAGSMHVVEWVARSYADLTWDLTSTAGTVAYLKVYANSTYTGTSASTTANLAIVGTFAVAFRGYV